LTKKKQLTTAHEIIVKCTKHTLHISIRLRFQLVVQTEQEFGHTERMEEQTSMARTFSISHAMMMSDPQVQ